MFRTSIPDGWWMVDTASGEGSVSCQSQFLWMRLFGSTPVQRLFVASLDSRKPSSFESARMRPDRTVHRGDLGDTRVPVEITVVGWMFPSHRQPSRSYSAWQIKGLAPFGLANLETHYRQTIVVFESAPILFAVVGFECLRATPVGRCRSIASFEDRARARQPRLVGVGLDPRTNVATTTAAFGAGYHRNAASWIDTGGLGLFWRSSKRSWKKFAVKSKNHMFKS